MKHMTKQLHQSVCEWSSCFSHLHGNPSDYCFFDIETTGLSPQISSVYLIGAACYQDGQVTLHQWFADDYHSEKKLLELFSDFVGKFSHLVHFNGSRFDIPYLEHKYDDYALESPFSKLTSIDTYKTAKKMKDCVHWENCKLKTVESALGFSRRDRFSGKDCINLYMDFMKKKVFYDESSQQCMNDLLLHNEDDLIATILSCLLLSYTTPALHHQTWRQSRNGIQLTQQSEAMPNLSFTLKNECGTLHQENSICTLDIPFVKDALYHYFPDYKNYYYLPEEDMAIHKSVATYVEAANRKKATKETCYIKKTGTFLPLPLSVAPATLSLFQRGLKEKRLFLLLEKDASYIEEHIQELYEKYWHEFF